MSQCLNPNCLHRNPTDTQFCQKCGKKLLLVERYRAHRIIGQGGFGRTFLAVDDVETFSAEVCHQTATTPGTGDK